MSETSREEIAKLCEQLTLESEAYHEAGRFHLEKLLDTVRDALLSQQRSLDRVAALCVDGGTLAGCSRFGSAGAAMFAGIVRGTLEAQPSPEVSE